MAPEAPSEASSSAHPLPTPPPLPTATEGEAILPDEAEIGVGKATGFAMLLEAMTLFCSLENRKGKSKAYDRTINVCMQPCNPPREEEREVVSEAEGGVAVVVMDFVRTVTPMGE